MQNPFETHNAFNTQRQGDDLAWEETVLDTRSPIEGFSAVREGSVRHWLWLPILICGVLAVIAVQLFRLQILQGKELRVIAEGNRLRQHLILAPRGFIQDRFGNTLARNTVSFRLVVVPVDLPKEGLDIEIQNLSQLLGLESQYVIDEIAKVDRTSFEPIVLAQDISQEQALKFATRSAEFVGFIVQATPIREYPDAKVFSHVLGYTGIVSSDELQDLRPTGYVGQDYIGKTGIEKQYENFLRGKNGQEQIEVDATGKIIKTLGTVEPQPGSIIQLNVDRDLQLRLYQAFQAKGTKGAAVVLDPRTGEVLALLSMPGFDNNLFAHGIKPADFQEMLNDKQLPLFNRAISGTYPPGSTVKPMVALAALEEGLVKEDTIIVDRGRLVIANQFDPRISYNFYGWKRDGLGSMNVKSAIAESSDIYFYTVSGGHPSSPIQGLGAERLAAYYRKFNLGKTTGIDLGGEKSGVVADPAWKAEYFKNDAIVSAWYLGDTYHIGIGQGDMLTTPLQAVLWTATIANNGIGYKPQLFRKSIGHDGQVGQEFRPEALIHTDMSPENFRTVQAGMRQTVTAGSGRQLLSLPITAAGKTGTSQFDGSDPSRTHAWFTAYAPFEDPQIAIAVLVEAGGEGHAAAVPIVKDTLKWWTEHRYDQ